MKKITLLLVLISLFFINFSFAQDNQLKNGIWKGVFTIQDTLQFPFYFKVENQNVITILNGKDRVELLDFKNQNDSIKVYFRNYPNFLLFKKHSSNNIAGYFMDSENHTPVYFSAKYAATKIPKPKITIQVKKSVAGKWKTTFRINSNRPYTALGQFDQYANLVNGTFMTKSGDARFLNGIFNQNILKLYAFDGSAVKLYVAQLNKDTLIGKYYSGNHYQTNWMAVRDSSFELANPLNTTKATTDSIQLTFNTLNGEKFIYPNPELKGKVIIFQIMGTWCPNCMDETNYFKTLYKKYHKDGLEIIAIAYENSSKLPEQIQRVKRFSKYKNIPYPILIGGSVKNQEVSKDFYFLNKFQGYPTSIFINRNGKIAQIYTGFKGPGTGTVYLELKQATDTFIRQLLFKDN